MTQLKDRTVWLTGASMGIGRAVALELGRRGATVVLTARSREPLETLCREIVDGGGTALVAAGDVTDLVRMKTLVADAEAAVGPIDMLIANAGTNINALSYDGYVALQAEWGLIFSRQA